MNREPSIVAIARAALQRGPLVRDWTHYRFGRRRFNSATVNHLLRSGEATRLVDGNVVRTP